MAWTLFHSFLEAQVDGSAVDFDTDTLKIALIDDTLAPAEATHDFWDDLATNEVSGTGYTAGGETLATKSVAESGGTVTFDADDVSWSQDASGFSDARYAVLYKDTGTDSTSPLIAYHDMTSDRGNVSGDLTLQMAATGIITWAAA